VGISPKAKLFNRVNPKFVTNLPIGMFAHGITA